MISSSETDLKRQSLHMTYISGRKRTATGISTNFWRISKNSVSSYRTISFQSKKLSASI